MINFGNNRIFNETDTLSIESSIIKWLAQPLSVNFWHHHRASFLGKKSKIINDDAKVGRKWKLYVPIECQLDYIMMQISKFKIQMAYANMGGNKPPWTKINAIFWNHNRACIPEKIRKHTQIDAILRSGFFSGKHARRLPRFGFFQDSRKRFKRYGLKS